MFGLILIVGTEGSSKENKDYYNGGAGFSCILNGYFERLISLMDFMNAASH